MQPHELEDADIGWTEEVAWVGVNHSGEVRRINRAFTEWLGWRAEDIVGRPLLNLVPAPMRDAHNVGFARFVEFGRGTLLGQPVILPVLTAAGGTVTTETYIQARRVGNEWSFGAQMAPLDAKAPAAG